MPNCQCVTLSFDELIKLSRSTCGSARDTCIDLKALGWEYSTMQAGMIRYCQECLNVDNHPNIVLGYN